jgi:hypothetical protein
LAQACPTSRRESRLQNSRAPVRVVEKQMANPIVMLSAYLYLAVRGVPRAHVKMNEMNACVLYFYAERFK